MLKPNPEPTTSPSRLHRVFDRLSQNTGRLLLIVGAITAVLLVPFLTMAPDTSASTEPTGDVFTARDRIDDTFISSVHPTLVIVEHESGQILTSDALGDLFDAQEALRSDPELGATLFRTFDVETRQDINGVLSLADLVDHELRAQGIDGIAAASDAEVLAVLPAILVTITSDR